MPSLATRSLAGGLDLTVLRLGGTGLDNMYTADDTATAVAPVEDAFARGIRYFDTAPFTVSDSSVPPRGGPAHAAARQDRDLVQGRLRPRFRAARCRAPLGPVAGARFGYQPATPAMLDHVGRIAAVCTRHGLPLAAAALQFPLGHPPVVNVIPGPRSAAELRQNLGLLCHPIPPRLWDDLTTDGLLAATAPTGQPAPG